MTPESIAELRVIIEHYHRVGHPGILANWCNRVDNMVMWRAAPPGALYVHFLEAKP